MIDIEMDGFLAKALPNYCRCYLLKESLYPSATPTDSPSLSPSSSSMDSPSLSLSASPTDIPGLLPSANPIEAVTDSPTQDPISRPSDRSVIACDYSEILITELASIIVGQ